VRRRLCGPRRCHLFPLYPLHGATPAADHCRHLQDALAGPQMRPDGVLHLRRDPESSKFATLLAIAVQAGQALCFSVAPFREGVCHVEDAAAKTID
jgi:hypothetical protein